MDELLQTEDGKKELNEILEKKDTNDFYSTAGCTANVCIIDKVNNKIYCANAGDSRSVVS